MSSEESNSDCEVAEEVQSGYPPQIDAAAAEPLKALTSDDVEEYRTAFFPVSLPAGSTLETLQEKYPNGFTWRPTEGQKLKMLHINRTKNRANATSEDLVGSKAKMLVLDAKITHDITDCPKELGVTIHGLVPLTYATSGHVFNHVILPGSSGERSQVGFNIFDPNHKFTREMYVKDGMLTKKELDETVRVGKKLSTIETGSAGWNTLQENLEKGHFAEHKEEIERNTAHLKKTIGQPAVVPYQVAKAVHTCLAEPIAEIQDSYINLDDFSVKIEPSDMQAWTNPVGLIRDAMPTNEESKANELAHQMNRPIRAGAVIELKYVFGAE